MSEKPTDYRPFLSPQINNFEIGDKMYKIKVENGRTPMNLNHSFTTYNDARASLRKYFREHLPLSSGHVAIRDMKDVGYNIVKV
jgi:hypothetical protein